MDTHPAVPDDEETLPDELPQGGESMEEAFSWMSQRQAKRLAIPNQTGFTRKQIVSSFQSAFELIGGVPRLAVWAHENPGDFYRIYGKLLPSQSQQMLSADGTLRIIHSIAPGALDAPPETKAEEEVTDAEFTESNP